MHAQRMRQTCGVLGRACLQGLVRWVGEGREPWSLGARLAPKQ